MPWIVPAAIMGGGAVIGAIGANQAARTQASAENAATQAQLDMFNTVNSQQKPYREAGYTALGDIMGGFGLPGGTNTSTTPGQFAHQFNASDLNANLAPNYQFMLDQGLGAVKNASNLSGGMFSGNTLKAINDYAQNYAGNAYQKAFENYNTNQNNIFNRLSSIAGLGQVAGAAGTTGAPAFSAGIANTMGNAGAARASGIVGAANALSQGATNAGSWYMLNSFMHPSNPGGYLGEGVQPGINPSTGLTQ